ncbi:hypothetical protein COCON_G00166430 [Conger conger]|uniref:THAP-type domain-containing protein n=1 Tax=Conger conger TaxID=82655 RepID=A0A9Q1D742_CONCO|nr:hypothetical protein COCON_G00166430 [Conger conger]
MPESCVAWGCTNRRTIQNRCRGITFHRFPKQRELRRQWEIAVRREGFSASESSVLCSEHFKPEDFDRTGQLVRIRDGTKPSVFIFPTHLQRPVATRKTQASRNAEESLSVDCSLPFPETKPLPTVAHSRTAHKCADVEFASLTHKHTVEVELMGDQIKNEGQLIVHCTSCAPNRCDSE